MSLNVLSTGAGPPLLALHGFTGTARSWSGQLAAWSVEHRVVAPDLLGHGGSEAPSDPDRFRLERQADELAKLLTLLEADPASVVGYSMGARLALVLALRHPHAVERLVLESPSAGIADAGARDERRRADEALAARLERDGVETFIDHWERQPLFASHADLPEQVRAEQRRERLRHSAAGLAASLRGAGQGAMEPLHDRLPLISAPTLVLAGSLDPIGLERAEAVAVGIPGARLERILGAGHTPHLERPDPFTTKTTDFLTVTQPSHTR